MKIINLSLENIKNFGKDSPPLDFENSNNINTISGTNGSGKTAAFKAIQLFQKIFFYYQIQNQEDQDQIQPLIKKSLDQITSSETASIDLTFEIDRKIHNIALLISNRDTDFNCVFQDITDRATQALEKIWNINEPRSLIVFLEAGKSFSDFGVSFENISLKPRRQKKNEFLLDCIFTPEETLQAIYKRTVLDHIHYRIDPSRTYEHFRAANETVKKIAPNIDVRNISATKVDGQLVMLGKTSESAQPFDVKDFSAGERALYLTILYLFYLPNIGTLIIDEPENHFHETMLSGFYRFLRDLVESGSINNWLSKNIVKSKDAAPSQEHSELEQIFLITHSKPLIYQNLNFGSCYVLTSSGLKKIEIEGAEKELRASGLSSVFSRTLFVEGKGDVEILSSVLSLDRIQTVPLNDCKEVIDHFKKLSSIRNSIHGASFCFAIDGDNRSDEEVAEIRAIDPVFFDQSFIVLNRHEIENYLIDTNLITESLNPILLAIQEKELSDSSIKSILNEVAESLKSHSKTKYISSLIKQKSKSIFTDPLSNTKSLANSVENTITSVFSTQLKETIESTARDAERKFNEEWKERWVDLVDGKAFIGKLMQKLSTTCYGLTATKIKSSITSSLIRNPQNYESGKLIEEIKNKIQDQEGLSRNTKERKATVSA
jgi:hypothetical protein